MSSQIITSGHLEGRGHRSKALEEPMPHKYSLNRMKKYQDATVGVAVVNGIRWLKRDKFKPKNYC